LFDLLLLNVFKFEQFQKESFSLTPDCRQLRITKCNNNPISAKTTSNDISSIGKSTDSSFPIDTSFDIGLKLSTIERQAKSALTLPYTSAQSPQGLVGIGARKVRAGGQIIYTPDTADDFDDSDPDEDLMI
jgi:hypothetical protein